MFENSQTHYPKRNTEQCWTLSQWTHPYLSMYVQSDEKQVITGLFSNRCFILLHACYARNNNEA